MLGALVVALIAGCGDDSGAPSASGPPSSTASSSATAEPTSTPTPVPTPTPGAGETGVSAGLQYTVTRTAIEGDSPDGRGSWTTDYGLLAGGDPRVVQAFNGASQAAAQDQVDSTIDGTSGGTTPWTFESNGTVSFRLIAVAQIIYGSLDYGAHPSHQIGTVVIDTRSAKPVMLTELFTDPQAAVTVLADQTRSILAADGLEVAPDAPGAEPRAENFANWIPTAEGLEFHFNEYQFGPRLPAVATVPWSAITDLMTPAMAELAQN